MNNRHNETKIFFNVLTGGIKILSESGRVDYARTSESWGSPEDRIKYTVGLLKMIRKLRVGQTSLAEARRKLIEVQISPHRH